MQRPCRLLTACDPKPSGRVLISIIILPETPKVKTKDPSELTFLPSQGKIYGRNAGRGGAPEGIGGLHGMYKILKNTEEHTILLPATLDEHFPLLKYMFWSKGNAVVPLTESDEFAVREEGLKYSNYDICYPYVLMAGQIMRALRSGKYDPKKTSVLIPTAGDACRGACYIGMMEKSLTKAGFPDTHMVTINVRHVCNEISLKITTDTAIRGLFGMFYGDILMMLANQTRPYEAHKGETEALRRRWYRELSKDIRLGRHLTLRQMRKNFTRIAESFRAIERTGEKRQQIGIVAEFYAKYCALGNWNLIPYLEEHGCEAIVGGLSWYMLYYIDSHKPAKWGPERVGFEAVKKLMTHVQTDMLYAMKKAGFHVPSRYEVMDKNSRPYVSHNLINADGWLMGAEAVDHIRHGVRKILCNAPFGCLPNVCAGRGVYPNIRREFPDVMLMVIETDSAGSKLNYFNRVQMVIDTKMPPRQRKK